MQISNKRIWKISLRKLSCCNLIPLYRAPKTFYEKNVYPSKTFFIDVNSQYRFSFKVKGFRGNSIEYLESFLVI